MEDYDNRITEDDIQMAERITRTSLGSSESRPLPIPVGSVNKVFRVTSAGQPWILRFSEEGGTLSNYQKEHWCTEQARTRGIPTPEIVQIGQQDTLTFMIQRFVDGMPGTDPSLNRTVIWSALGAHLSTIHAIPTEGFGLRLHDARTGQFTESWERHLAYNLSVLGPQDELRRLGLLNVDESTLLAECFMRLRCHVLTFGLCHGDVSLRNAILDSASVVHLLDWGCGHSHVVPYSDFASILRWEHPTREEFAAFLAAYGVPVSAFAQMQPLLTAMTPLTATDKLRWALDHDHAALGRYRSGLRWALMIASGHGDWFSIPYTEDYGEGLEYRESLK